MLIELARFFSAFAKPFQDIAKTRRGVENISADLRHLNAEMTEHRERMRQLLGALHHSASNVHFNDEAASWSGLCGDNYTARNPTFAQEVPWIPVAGGGGQWRLRTDAERVKVWAARLSPEGPCELDIIFMVGAHTLRRDTSARLSAYALDNVIRFVYLVRAVRKTYPQADLSKINIYLVAAPRSHQSVFVAQRIGPSGIEEVGITYSDARDPISRNYMAPEPRPLIVTRDPQIIKAWTAQNDHLRAAATRQMTFEELEEEFGALVPQDETETITDVQIRNWATQTGRDQIAETQFVDEDYDVNTYDGHFYFKPRNLSLAQREVLNRLALQKPKTGTDDTGGNTPAK